MIKHVCWVRHLQTVVPGRKTDHDAVMLRPAAPHMHVHVRRPRKVYPTRPCGAGIARQNLAVLFETLDDELKALESKHDDVLTRAQSIAQWWDAAKKRF